VAAHAQGARERINMIKSKDDGGHEQAQGNSMPMWVCGGVQRGMQGFFLPSKSQQQANKKETHPARQRGGDGRRRGGGSPHHGGLGGLGAADAARNAGSGRTGGLGRRVGRGRGTSDLHVVF
jgi:hypothetical protein